MSKKGVRRRQGGGRAVVTTDPRQTWSCSWNTLQSNKNGIFRSIFENVEETLTPAQVNAFGQLDTDYDRVVYLVAQDVVQNIAPVPMFRKKNAAEAQTLMQQAASCLDKGNDAVALNLLSRAITKAPTTGEMASGLLALRSRALSNLEQHELALRDTQLALSGGVADASARARLLRTQGRCYYALGDQIRAKVAFGSGLRLLDANNPELRAELQLELQQCDYPNPANSPKLPKTGQVAAPQVTGGTSVELEHASSLLGVQESAVGGRFVVANSKIDAGDVLAVEPPYCCVLLPDMAGTHCHHCMARLVSPVGCADCSGVAFCGRECQQLACGTYHKTECHFLNLFVGLGMSVLCHLALRIVARTGSVVSFLKMWESARGSGGGSAANAETAAYGRFLRLVGHGTQRQTKDYLSRALMAVVLLKCLKACDSFWSADLSAKQELTVGEALLKHLCILQFNAHEVFETLARQRTSVKGSKTQYIGVGVYLAVALFNHDCHPAVARCFQGTKMVVHALRPVQPGEMVGENYGPLFSKKTFSERQKALRARYWFDCACHACTLRWNTFDQGIKSKIKTEGLQKMFDMGFEAMESGKLEGAIYLLSQFINSSDGLVTMPDREVCLAIDSLRLSLMSHWGTVVEIQQQQQQQPQKQQLDDEKYESSVQITELTDE